MSSVPSNPWPDEPYRIIGARTALAAYQHTGECATKVLKEAEALGYLSPPQGVHLHIDTRVSFQEAGETQHYREDWHKDEAYLGWIFVVGPGPTQLRDRFGRLSEVPQGKWTAYHGVEHRCPPQPKRGWRFFIRVLWCDSPGQNATMDLPSSPVRWIR